MFAADATRAGFIKNRTITEEEAEWFRFAAESEPPTTLGRLTFVQTFFFAFNG